MDPVYVVCVSFLNTGIYMAGESSGSGKKGFRRSEVEVSLVVAGGGSVGWRRGVGWGGAVGRRWGVAVGRSRGVSVSRSGGVTV